MEKKYAVDVNGNSTDDPVKAKTLLPIGDYKGFGLAAMGKYYVGFYLV